MKTIQSNVIGHIGVCTPIWLNTNSVHVRLDGGTCGFFRNVKKVMKFFRMKTGKEFHGIIKNGVVESTQM